ncbi:hypothetical protein PENTCL1PPCAC_9122 [Pristionchus entomophagus]|uniref:UDP-glucuronosyltransferase n=1 Tax=Pristionchus entomophagus TaxID=358040 RepID=A0AAV5SW18_9BILA|nr:hypothetical protein PENTCL1PPCAC_9122 [Pristionchus entomophagus]
MRVYLLLLVVFLSADAHKILVYNMKFAHSHSNFLGNIADLLVEAGHDVTSLIPEVNQKIKDGSTKTKVVRVAPHPDAGAVLAKMDTGEIDMFSFSELNPILPFIMNGETAILFGKQCEATLDSGEIEKLQKEKFDVYIVESFDFCGMMLSHLLKPRAVIKTSSTIIFGDHFDELGVPFPHSYNPSSLTRSLDVHSMSSRAWNFYADYLTRLQFSKARSNVQTLFKERFGADYPSLKEISSNVAYVFTNTEPLIDFATPTLTRVIDIGGLGAKVPKELDEYWTSVMTRRPKVVLMSFGSMAKSYLLAPTVKEALLKVVSSFPSVTFIWKYEKKDEFALGDAAKIDNLVLTDWMPQNDLLNHPNLAVFITHGGMGSVQELALRGKPAILIPIFGDQPRNAAMIEHNRLGKVLGKLEIGNHEKIIALLKELMGNPEYANNSRRVAQMLLKKPFSSKEKLLKHVDFAAEFGPSSALRPQSQDMSFIQYHNLDILLVAFIFFLVAAYLSLKVACWVLRRVFVGKVKNE